MTREVHTTASLPVCDRDTRGQCGRPLSAAPDVGPRSGAGRWRRCSSAPCPQHLAEAGRALRPAWAGAGAEEGGGGAAAPRGGRGARARRPGAGPPAQGPRARGAPEGAPGRGGARPRRLAHLPCVHTYRPVLCLRPNGRKPLPLQLCNAVPALRLRPRGVAPGVAALTPRPWGARGEAGAPRAGARAAGDAGVAAQAGRHRAGRAQPRGAAAAPHGAAGVGRVGAARRRHAQRQPRPPCGPAPAWPPLLSC